jgi:membrane-associated phospholipid phosphatase
MNLRRSLLSGLLAINAFILPASAQEQFDFAKDPLPENPEYKYNWKVDGPITLAGTAWTLYGFTQVYSKEKSTIAEIQALNKDDINGFDRWAAGMSSKDADTKSNYLFYGLIPAPFLLAGIDKRMRSDFWKINGLYIEAMAITGTLYTGATFFVDRYRPETYDNTLTLDERTNGNYKNAFFAGHVANVATISFFTAKIFNDYHRNNPWRWAVWGGAAVATGITAYYRHEAGKHFPSDILLGTAVGVASGILVPQLHKNRRTDGRGLGISPMLGPYNGMSLSYRF